MQLIHFLFYCYSSEFYFYCQTSVSHFISVVGDNASHECPALWLACVWKEAALIVPIDRLPWGRRALQVAVLIFSPWNLAWPNKSWLWVGLFLWGKSWGERRCKILYIISILFIVLLVISLSFQWEKLNELPILLPIPTTCREHIYWQTTIGVVSYLSWITYSLSLLCQNL